MIFLSELNERDRQGVANYLTPFLLHDTIGIVVAKSGSLFDTDRENLVSDYGTAAYVGQRLGEYAPTMEYDYAEPDEGGDFRFAVPINDHAKLVDLLFDLSHGFGNGDDEAPMFFWDEVETFVVEVDAGQVKPFCPELVALYHELVASLNEEDELDEDD